MNSLAFPKMFVANNTSVFVDKTATLSNLKLLLLSKVGEFFGDPEYGSPIVQQLYKFNNVILEDILKDIIYTSICNYFPQIIISMEDITITRDNDNIYVELLAFNDITKTIDAYQFDLAS